MQRCSYCGQHYPYDYSTYTCHVCGGLIESDRASSNGLSVRNYLMSETWHDWRRKMLSAPPRPCKESDWLEACAHFNGCAFCGSQDIATQHLFIGTNNGGKYYSYNVVPACDTCEKCLTSIVRPNPIAAYMALPGMTDLKLDRIMSYLETKMLGVVFEEFDFDNDSVDVICRCTEDTDNVPFDGIIARRRFDYPIKIATMHTSWANENMPYRTRNEIVGVTWRLLDDEGYEEMVRSNRRSDA